MTWLNISRKSINSLDNIIPWWYTAVCSCQIICEVTLIKRSMYYNCIGMVLLMLLRFKRIIFMRSPIT